MIGIDMKMPRNCINCHLEYWSGESAVCAPLKRRILTNRCVSRLPDCPLRFLDDEIRVGDEVHNFDKHGAVTFIWKDGDVDVVTKSGMVETWGRDGIERTGRHFDEVESLLRKMRGEDDG